MLRPRIIVCLLLRQGELIKTINFKDPTYLGDPINAVRIFNEKEADELMVLDIGATMNKTEPNFELIGKMAAECSMPFCYGGGITNAVQAARIVDLGVEKVAVSYGAILSTSLLTEMATAIGRQSVVAVLDVRKRVGLGVNSYEICTHNSKIVHHIDPVAFAVQAQDAGAGEIVLNSVDKDGLMQGYDLELAREFKNMLKVPLTMLGGAGSFADIRELIENFGLVGAAAGSKFVFKGKYRAVLMNYPNENNKIELSEILNNKWPIQGRSATFG